MSKEDDNLLRFLSTEKFDLENCSENKSTPVKGQSADPSLAVERDVPAGPMFWTFVASLLLILSLVSGAHQFFPILSVMRLSNPRVVPLKVVEMSDVTKRDLGKPLSRAIPEGLYKVPLRHVVSKVPSIDAGVDVVRDVVEKERSVPLLRGRVFGPCRNVDLSRLRIDSRGNELLKNDQSSLASKLSIDDKGVVSKASGVGRFIVTRPFKMKYNRVKSSEEKLASFQTTFVFSIENTMGDRDLTKEGLTFVMLSRGNVPGSTGGKLAVVETSKDLLERTFAVHFGSRGSLSVHGSSAGHVGIRTGSSASVTAASAGFHSQAGEFQSLDLTRGRIQAWVEFNGITKEITVSVSPILGTKPVKPLLSQKVDLSKLLEKFVSVGFSAATHGFSTKHTIHSWHFEKSVKIHSGRSEMSSPYDFARLRSLGHQTWQHTSALQDPARDHLSRLPLFLYPSVNRENGDGGLLPRQPYISRVGDPSGRSVASTSSTTLQSFQEKMRTKTKPCHSHGSAGFNFSSIKDHVLLRSVWVILAVVSGLLFFHFLFITYRMCVRCCDFFQGSDDAEGSDYFRIVDPREHVNQDVRYVLVVSPEHQSQERPLALV